jgi:hypothetical protein
MRTQHIFLTCAAAAALLVACSSSTNTPGTSSGTGGTSSGDPDGGSSGTSGSSGGDGGGGGDGSTAGCAGGKAPSASLLAAVNGLGGGWKFETTSSDPCVFHQGLLIGVALTPAEGRTAEACAVAGGGYVPIAVGLDNSEEAKTCVNNACPLNDIALFDDDSFNGVPAMKAYIVKPGGVRGAYAGRLTVADGKLTFQSATTTSTYVRGSEAYSCVKK